MSKTTCSTHPKRIKERSQDFSQETALRSSILDDRSGSSESRYLAQDLSHHNTGARHHTEEGIE